MSPARRALAGVRVALVGCALVCSTRSRAQDPAPTVAVTVVGTADDLERVRGLAPRLSAGGAPWSRVDRMTAADVLREHRDGDAAVRAWVDMSSATRARLYFATRSERFLVRDVDLSGRFDEVDRAALGEVLESSVDALIANERAGLTRAEAEVMLAHRDAPAPPPVIASPAPKQPTSVLPPRLPALCAVGFFYAAQALSDGPTLDHGPGLTLAVAAFPHWRLANKYGRGPVAFASMQYRLPIHESGSRIGVGLYTIAPRAGLEAGPLAWERLRLRLTAGVDLVHVAPESTEAGATLSATHWSASFVVSAALRANLLMLQDRAWLSVVLLADVLPTAVRYDAAINGATEPVFSPWRVRPGLTLEMTFF